MDQQKNMDTRNYLYISFSQSLRTDITWRVDYSKLLIKIIMLSFIGTTVNTNCPKRQVESI